MVVLAGFGGTPGDLRTLHSDLTRLGSEIQALGRIELAQVDPSRVARFEVRLGQLEEELRRLTGRIERIEFEQRSLGSRLDTLLADLDQRLAEFEAGEDGSEASPAPGAAAAERTRALGPDPVDEAGAETFDEALGSIPESATAGLDRPDPATVTAAARRDLPPNEQYADAMALLRAGDYAGAERGLGLFLELHPNHPLAANAAYWLGETHYVRRDYAAAASAFARNYRSYGRDVAKAPDNLLKLGMSLHGLGDDEKACLTFAELNQEFPDAAAHIQQALTRERARASCS